MGVFVLAFMNLRFGWVLSGIVVPGYLVPLLLIKPVAVLVIGVEAVVTYLVVWTISEQVSRTGLWSGVFGRDRFFLIIVVSIIVRVVFDGAVLPAAGRALVDQGVSFDYADVLHSFGLIVIALLANQFWKTGLVRGIPQAITVTAVTYLIVRYGLMELTNFRMADIGYLYEDLAASVLATPKAYIILVTTAFIASRLNLHYGWDFNGILIPSLIALQWVQPMKVVSSIAEAFVILAIAVLLLRTPLFANRTMEGARKLLLFFSIAFAYRYVLGWTLPFVDVELVVSDFFGFGYLLSTLIAMKIHDKGIPARLTRATLQVSAMGLVFGTGIGFFLAESASVNLLRTVPVRLGAAAPDAVPSFQASSPFDAMVAHFRIGAYETSARMDILPDVATREGFVQAVRAILDGDASAARTLLDDVGGRLRQTTEGFLVLDVPDRPVWGLYAIDPAADSDLVIEVADPLARRNLLDAAVLIFKGQGAKALAINGARFAGGASDGATPPGFATLYHAFHQVAATGPVLLVDAAAAAGGPVLRLESPVPDALDTAFLDRLAGPLTFVWGRPAGRSLQATTAPYLAHLSLNGDAIRRSLFRAGGVNRDSVVSVRIERASDYLRRRLLEGDTDAPTAGRAPYRTPSLKEILFLDVEVVTPLLEAARSDDTELAALANAGASALGYRVVRLEDPVSGSWYVLEPIPQASAPARWGSVVFRIGPASAYGLQVPRPSVERNTLETALDLLVRTDARALAVTDSHALAMDPAADVTRPENAMSLFTLVSQVLLREAGGPFTVVQVRGFATSSEIKADALFEVYTAGTEQEAALDDPTMAPLTRSLEASGLTVALASNGVDEATVGGGRIPQRDYVEATQAGRFALLWLSPEARTGFAVADQGERVLSASLDLRLEEGDAAEQVAIAGLGAAGDAERAFIEVVRFYRRTGDVALLHRGLTAIRTHGREVGLIIDRATLRGLFTVRLDGRMTALVKTAATEAAATLSLTKPDAATIAGFLRGPADAALADEH